MLEPHITQTIEVETYIKKLNYWALVRHMAPERWPKVMIAPMMDNAGDQTKWLNHVIDLTEQNGITIEENVDKIQTLVY